MCKKINRFFPILMICYLGGAFSAGIILAEQEVPIWFSLLLSQMLILVPMLIFAAVQKINIIKCLPYGKFKISDIVLSLLFGYMMLPLMLLINYISMQFSTNVIQQSTEEIAQYPFLIQLFLMAVVPAFIEEFVFRGMFFHSYRKNGLLPAALLSGVIFGIVHMNINQFMYACVLGFLFAMLVEATGSMYASMAAHFAVNSYSIIMIHLVPQAVQKSGESQQLLDSMPATGVLMTVVIFAIFAVSFGMVGFVIYRTLAKKNGTWEHICTSLKRGLRPQNGEKFLTIPLIVTAVLCIIYMVAMELL